jgi:MFS family permease
MSMMGDVVDPSERGRYFSHRTRLIMCTMLVCMVLAGWIINRWENAGHPVAGFGFLFGIACLARLLSLFFMRRHYDAPIQKLRDDSYFSFFDFVRAAPRSNFARFSFTVALMNGTAQIAGPFFPVYMLKDLHWSYLQFTVNMACFLLSQTLFVRWWGALGDRHGNRSILVATCWIMPVLPLFWIFSSDYFVLLLAQVLSGACWSGFNLAASNFIYDAVSQAKRARVFSYYNLLNGLFSVAGGVLVGAPIARHVPAEFTLGLVQITMTSALPAVFLVSAAARALVAWLMLPQFREVRSAEPISTVRILWRLGIGQPLFAQAGEFMKRYPFPGSRRKEN